MRKRHLHVILIALFCGVSQAQPQLSEVVAKNLSFPDARGEYPDWIEIHNPGGEQINLKNLYLSDDRTNLTKWKFPEDQFIPANGYLIVFASGEDGILDGQPHTNFKLSSNQGEALTLTDSDGVNVISTFPNGFPPLQDGQPFGKVPGEDPLVFHFLETPTPGNSNSQTIQVPRLGKFEISHEEITLGESATLSWTDALADDVKIYSAIGSNAFTYYGRASNTTGQREVVPRTTTIYEIRAQNKWSSVVKRVTVTVNLSLENLRLEPSQIVQGGRTVVWWNTDGLDWGPQGTFNFGDGFGERTAFPLVYTPFNQVLISAGSTWRTSENQDDMTWLEPSFDDSTWMDISLPDSGFGSHPLRKVFQVEQPNELLNCTLRTLSLGGDVYLNGHKIDATLVSFRHPHQFQEFEVPIELLRSGPNVLSTTGWHPWVDFGLTAWRYQSGLSTHNVPFTFTQQGDEIAAEIPIELIDPDQAEEEAPLALNEVNFNTFLEEGLPHEQFVEILNHGNQPLDLQGFQIIGRAIAELGAGDLTSLPPQGLGVAGFYSKSTLLWAWPGDLPVVATFVQPYPIFYGSSDYAVELLDPLGRTIDKFLFNDFPKVYDKNHQRINPLLPFSRENTISTGAAFPHIQGTPGEHLFYINSATMTPAYAQPGDPVTFRWDFSRDTSFELAPTAFSAPNLLEGKSGEFHTSLPLNTDGSQIWQLRILGEVSTFRSSVVGARLLPQVSSFSSAQRVYPPGQDIVLNWKTHGAYAGTRITIDGEIIPGSWYPPFTHLPLDMTAGERIDYALTLYSRDTTLVSTPMTILFEDGNFSYSAWRDQHALPAIDSGDFDGDTLDDLMEYALGSDPRQKNHLNLEISRNPEGDFHVSFPHHLLATDVDLSVEISYDQVHWNSPPFGYGFSFLSSLAPKGSYIATDRYQLLGQPTRSRYFFRLRAKLKIPEEDD